MPHRRARPQRQTIAERHSATRRSARPATRAARNTPTCCPPGRPRATKYNQLGELMYEQYGIKIYLHPEQNNWQFFNDPAHPELATHAPDRLLHREHRPALRVLRARHLPHVQRPRALPGPGRRLAVGRRGLDQVQLEAAGGLAHQGRQPRRAAAGASGQPVHADLDARRLPDQRRRPTSSTRPRATSATRLPVRRRARLDPAPAPRKPGPDPTRDRLPALLHRDALLPRARASSTTSSRPTRAVAARPIRAAPCGTRRSAPSSCSGSSRCAMSVRFSMLAVLLRARCAHPRSRSPMATRRATISRPARSTRPSRQRPSQDVELQLIGLLDAAQKAHYPLKVALLADESDVNDMPGDAAQAAGVRGVRRRAARRASAWRSTPRCSSSRRPGSASPGRSRAGGLAGISRPPVPPATTSPWPRRPRSVSSPRPAGIRCPPTSRRPRSRSSRPAAALARATASAGSTPFVVFAAIFGSALALYEGRARLARRRRGRITPTGEAA